MHKIRRVLRSLLARFRKAATPAPPRRQITTAEAWDLWREACCDERGGHVWQKPKHPFGRDYGRDHVTFTCRCCPATVDVYPANGTIRLPWGITVPVITGECEHCGAGFRQIKDTAAEKKYCSQTHAKAASKARTRPARRDAREAELRVAREAAQQAARLAACAEKNKPRYADERSASIHAGTLEIRYARRQYPYECPCGFWHLTTEPPDARERAEALKRTLFREAGTRASRGSSRQLAGQFSGCAWPA